MNFWEKMQKPILCLAPMADVTDAAFRYVIAKYSKRVGFPYYTVGEPYSYVTFTEFVSADGLARAPEEGRQKLLKDLEYSEIERPIVAQFFTSKPEYMEKAAALAVGLGFDGVDINMGCPDRSVEKQGAGAALIKNPSLARELIAAAKKGAPNLPISVKTRLGYNKDELETWLPELLKEAPAAIILHARTRKEMSKVPARWERIKDAVVLREKYSGISEPIIHNANPKTLIIGNGDIVDIDNGRRKCEEAGCDGVMLGRAIFGNPFLFSNHTPTPEEKLKVLVEHTKLFEQKFMGVKSFAIMRKHFKAYLSGIPLVRRSFSEVGDSHDLRLKLMEAENAQEVERIIKEYVMLI